MIIKINRLKINKMVHLSERLLGVYSLITPGLSVADIGTDHGYLPIYLIKNGKASKVIASDVNKGPLEKARENIEQYELNNEIELRLSDGLKMYEPGEAQAIVMAGMGGNLIIDIISNSLDVCNGACEMILQPQSDVCRVRHFLHKNGFRIISENMVKDENKFYPMMKVIKESQKWDSEIFYIYGKVLLDEQNPVLREYLIREKDILFEIYNNLNEQEKSESIECRLKSLEEEIEFNRRATEYISRISRFEEVRVLV